MHARCKHDGYSQHHTEEYHGVEHRSVCWLYGLALGLWGCDLPHRSFEGRTGMCSMREVHNTPSNEAKMIATISFLPYTGS